jgi:hypothetical protein
VDQRDPAVSASDGQVRDGSPVYPEGRVLLGFRVINGGPRGAIDDNIWLVAFQCSLQRVPVGDIEAVAGEARDMLALGG